MLQYHDYLSTDEFKKYFFEDGFCRTYVKVKHGTKGIKFCQG